MNFQHASWIYWSVPALAGLTSLLLFAIGKRAAAVRMLVAIVGTLFLAWTVLLPVRNDQARRGDDTVDIIYLGLTDVVYVRDLARIQGARPTVIVGSPSAFAEIGRAFPAARFVAPSGGPAPDGVTLTVALADLETRLADLHRGGRVIFFAPRTAVLGRDLAQLAELKKQNRWLVERLYQALPGAGHLTDFAQLPTILAEAPREVDPDAKMYRVDLVGSSPDGVSVGLTVGHIPDADNPRRHPANLAADGTIKPLGDPSALPAPPVPVPAEGVRYSGNMLAPRHGQTKVVMARIATPYNEVVDLQQIHTSASTPEVLVLLPKNRPTDSSAVLNLLRKFNLPVRAIALDLDTPGAKHSNSRILARCLLLVIDTELSAAQGGALRDVMGAAQKLSGAAPACVFVGTAGFTNPPVGWGPFLANIPMTRDVGRHFAFVIDQSGSMSLKVDKFGGKTKLEIAFLIARELEKGLSTRDQNGLIFYVGPDGNRISKEAFLKLDDHQHHWEAGAHLIAIKNLVEAGKPISDVLMLCDNRDLPGLGSAPPDALTPPQVECARWLLDHGVRLHLISIGGDLSDKVPQFIRDCVRVRFDDQPSLDALNTAIQREIYEKTFPRLQVVAEDDGLKSIEKSKADPMRDAASRALLVNVLARFEARTGLAAKDRVLLSAKHYADDRIAPILTTGLYESGGLKLPVAWLTIDPIAELAKSPSDRTELRDALADLLIASLNALTPGLRRPPVTWFFDARAGRLSVVMRDFTPFTLGREALWGELTVGAARRAAKLDVRRLDRVGFVIGQIGPGEVGVFKAKLTSPDPAIGEQSARLPIVGVPPLLVRDSADLRLIGPDYGDALAEDAARASLVGRLPAESSLSIPAPLLPWLVALAFVGLAAIIYKR